MCLRKRLVFPTYYLFCNKTKLKYSCKQEVFQLYNIIFIDKH